MIDLHARLTDALVNRLADYNLGDRGIAERLVDTLLNLPGIAIIELTCGGCGSTDPDRIHYAHCQTIGGR